MKVIFLDIDGVLNSQQWARIRTPAPFLGKQRRPWEIQAEEGIDPDAVSRLNRIVRAAKANVVLSSTWRIDTPLVTMTRILKYRGFKGHLFGATPYIARSGSHVRGDEIAWWLQHAHPVTGYTILDDDNDMGNLRDHLVQTSYKVGLTEHDADLAIHMLIYQDAD